MVDFRKQKLCDFVAWARQHITGDEKGEAQIFLDRLFQAFGQGGIKEAGATFETRVKQADNKGTAFADLVWKPVVLIEMKKRGADLTGHYRQAFDYWTRLVPGRPRYVVLCNFDEFWVYDFQTQMDVPVDALTLDQLPDRYGPLNFLFPTQERPVFGNDLEAVTREAADRLALCFNKLVGRSVNRDTAQKFILQILVALFAEDIGLLDKYFVTNLLDDCKSPTDSFDLLGGLFDAMNSRQPRSGGRFRGVPYFDGGLFATPARVELYGDELAQLREAAKSDWSKVRPEIFGTLFEHSLDKEARHAFGQHFTNPVDIMKIVTPTIVEPWRERIESAKTIARLRDLHQRMLSYTVLDPACGGGNFLCIAYREIKRLEVRILDRIAELSARGAPEQLAFGFVTARQFYGMDISPFACELAKVTMMIARKLAIDELHVTEHPLPLDNLDANFIVGDALIDPDGKPVNWPKTDVIIGNPPFLGSRYAAKAHGYPYVRLLHAAYPEVPQMADYCVYWLRKAHDHLPACTAADPLAGRAGLVGTQNIRNNQSRVGGLDHIARTGTIIEAVDNQPWSGEANVHVSIVNWVKTQDAALLPPKRRLWSRTNPPAGVRKLRKRGSGPASKEYELAYRDVPSLSSALSADQDTSAARVLACNATPKTCYVGQYPFNEGFYVETNRALAILAQDQNAAEVLFPYMIGRDLVTDGMPARWIIDFDQLSMLDACKFPELFDQVKERVMPVVLAKAAAERKATGRDSTRWTRLAERWWQFRDYQPGTMRAIAAVPRYIVCSRVTMRPVFAFVSNRVHPDNALMVFPFADDYSFGVLQSDAHWQWFITKCSKLGATFRYTAESVFDTFPWPQKPTARQVKAVAAAGREIRRIRAGALPNMKGGLRALYRTLELPGANPLKDAHAALDAAVLAAYGFDGGKDLLAQLLELNLQVAGRIEQGQPVTAPGVPPSYPTPAALVTADCIGPGLT
jgi:SAM-dependent methyltransferase